MANTGDRKAQKYKVYSPRRAKPKYRKYSLLQNLKRGADESEDIQIGDRKAQISHYRVYTPKKRAMRGAAETLDERDIPALENPEAWKIWKNMLLTNQPKMQEFGSQLAVYMHCMLQ